MAENVSKTPAHGSIINPATGDKVNAETGQKKGNKRAKVNLSILDAKVQGLTEQVNGAGDEFKRLNEALTEQVNGAGDELKRLNEALAGANKNAEEMKKLIVEMGGKTFTPDQFSAQLNAAKVELIAAAERAARTSTRDEVLSAADEAGEEAFAQSLRGKSPKTWWERTRFHMKKGISADDILFVAVVAGAFIIVYQTGAYLLRNYVPLWTFWDFNSGIRSDRRTAAVLPMNGAGRPRVMTRAS